MGNTVCVTNEVNPLPPRMHFKCRYDPEDKSRTSLIYYDHKEIEVFIFFMSFIKLVKYQKRDFLFLSPKLILVKNTKIINQLSLQQKKFCPSRTNCPKILICKSI